ncbi:MAG: RNA-directed DNA polymerase [Chlamydiales bacterium]|jgi:RNA-directed DNA polymerase
MMNACRKSDRTIVPKKPSNKPVKMGAERVEGRGMPKENKKQQNMLRTQSRESVHSELQLIHQKAKTDKKMRFTALMHHIYNIDMLRLSYLEIKRNAAPGVDKETWESYGMDLENKLQDLSQKLKCGAYKAKPVRRVYIPKADGKQRPLGVTALEDKIVQRATAAVMNTVYEADFVGFSYGFRPKRGQHQALDALYVGISTKKVNYVFDADIRDFFNKISREWLIKFIKHRIADKRVLRLIQKWLNVGILEEGKIIYNEQGTPQGSSISPLLANVFLHYVYDLWVQQWRKQKARGEVIVVRFADDTVVGFQYESDAKQFQEELKKRLFKFGLELHPEKTRLIEYGRYAIERRVKRGKGKPETFTFLGFTHICGKRRKDGKFAILRQTIKKKMRSKIGEIKSELKRRMHNPIQETGRWLNSVLTGHYRYYGVPSNYNAMSKFRDEISVRWLRVLRRRGQKGLMSWEKMRALLNRWLPKPQICHEYPNKRMGVTI